MKATSKLISVVLILALCLSIFTVSASADIYEPDANGTTTINGGGLDENGDEIDKEKGEKEIAEVQTSQALNAGAPETVKVGPNDDLADAVKKGTVIELTGPVEVNGPLTIPAGVEIRLANNTLKVNGTGEAAIIASGAKISTGSLQVNGAVFDKDSNLTDGFRTAVSGSLTLYSTSLTLEDATEFGGVLVASGSCNKDLRGHTADGALLKDGSDPALSEEAVFAVYEIVPVAPKNTTLENNDGVTNGTNGTDGVTNGTNGTDGVTNGTNGTDGVTNGTNGTDGVTNGTNGTDGQTNGTNGTDGVTNGTNGTDGVTNGTNGTDGVTNGTNGTDGVTNGTNGTDGVTNGTNGTDGVTNGTNGTDGVTNGTNGTDGVTNGTNGTDGQTNGTNGTDGQTNGTNGTDGQTNGTNGTDGQTNGTNGTDGQTNGTENTDNNAQTASFENEDPVTIEEPKEKEYVDELRVDPNAQAAAEQEKITLTATDEVTGAVITVSGYMPEGLTLVVKHLDNSVIGGLADDEVALLAVDISLEDADHNVYEPFTNEDPKFRAVTVSITHPSLKNLGEDETLVIYHLADEGTETKHQDPDFEGTDTASFSTGSFSPFVIVATSGKGTARTGSDGEVHKKTIKITNLTGETYIKSPTQPIEFLIEGGAVPESVSIIDPDNVSGGNVDVYKAGYLIYGGDPGQDYVITDKDGNPKDPAIYPNLDPCKVIINPAAVKDAPTGKWAVVFWFKDTTNSGSTRVYMVQYIYILGANGIKGVGPNFDGIQTYEVEKCDYDALEVMLTADLDGFELTGPDGTAYASYWYDPSVKNQKMTVRIDGRSRTVNASEYFTLSDYYATDPLGHEYVAGKGLLIHDTLIKQLPYGSSYNLYVAQRNHKATEPENFDEADFILNVSPGIAVADGLTDYIKGRNTWIKFVACAPIDYDDDGTLAIWIGGQKISHDYYSISNDHQTLWIYRNLLDQLKSNNSYTLTARLWEWRNTPNGKVKDTWYPATASFNILAAGSTSYRSPKTGDESNVALWAAVLLLSGGAVIALVPKKKKSK